MTSSSLSSFLGDEITHNVPRFHVELLRDMCNMDWRRVAEAVPRGHAKTTMAKLAAVWHFINAPRIRFVVYLSDTANLATDACQDIMAFMQSPNFVSVFGPIKFERERAGEGNYIFHIPTLNKTCILKALGWGKQVRGLNINNQRPQLAIVDDLENEDTADSEIQFAKMKQWLYGAFIKALDKGWNKIVHIGNIHGLRSQLHKHVTSEFWLARQYGCLLTTKEPLWPDEFPLQTLQADLESYREQGLSGLWFAEMMNYPMTSENALIRVDEIYYAPPLQPGDSSFGFVTVDLAQSKETWAHETAVAVHMWNPHIHMWQIAEVFHQKGLDIAELYNVVGALMTKWNISICGIESYAYQGVVRALFETLRTIRHPLANFQFLPIHHGKQNKTAHIAAWASLLKYSSVRAPSYALTKGDWVITQQLLHYDARKHDNEDDVIDACSYGPQMTSVYMALIIDSIQHPGRYDSPGRMPDDIVGAYAMCAV